MAIAAITGREVAVLQRVAVVLVASSDGRGSRIREARIPRFLLATLKFLLGASQHVSYLNFKHFVKAMRTSPPNLMSQLNAPKLHTSRHFPF